MTIQVYAEALTKRFGDVTALDGADLTVERGHLLAVLGPSGCGKTTLLRLLAGFERPDSGRIVLAGRQVDGPGPRGSVPVHRRGVAVVPQEGALFPHLSIGENVGFGLGRGREKSARIDEVLDLVGLSGLARRYPHELSGGQQQRVSVARALAPRPALILLDEPFSALDAGLRTGLRNDIRAALAEDDATALLVTHDQAEALSIADEVAVMRDGRILQIDRPEQVYRRPRNAWVASFVGEATLLPGRTHGASTETALGALRLPEETIGSEHTVLVRPEQVVLCSDGATAAVERVTYHGHDMLVRLRLEGGGAVYSRMLSGPAAPREGDAVRVRVDGEVHVLPAETTSVRADVSSPPLPAAG